MAKRVAIALLLVALLGSCLAAYRRTVTYDGQVVVRCISKDGDRTRALLDHDSIDVWAIRADGSADIRMHRDLFVQMQPKFPECVLITDDLEAFVREAESKAFPAKLNYTADWFEEYYADIVSWYKDLASSHSDIVTFVDSIGKSVEGRDQPAVHITGGDSATVKKIYFQCQIHAREWISGATCMYVANYLVENYARDPTVKNLLDNLEFIVVPFTNPDGYAYTWTNDRLWRKNRRKGTICNGVDLNRNYPDHWGGGGSSGNACSETYRGPSEASEPETKNTVNYFKNNGPIIGAIDWHSFSQLILRPWGWTRTNAPDEAQLKSIGDGMSAEALKVHGKVYTSQKSIDLYVTTGTASDWFYTDDASVGNKGYRPAGYTIELRDTGRYGFILPPDQIIPTGQEMVPAVLYFAEELLKNPIPYKSSGNKA